MMRYLGLLTALLALQACASWRSKDASLADAMRTVAEFRSTSYKISPTDLLSVTVYPDQRLSLKARVDTDGALSLPLIGTAAVSGVTVSEAQRLLEQKLSVFLVNPHVTLVVEEYGNRQMFVLGEVQHPGSYLVPAGSRMTVLQAISTAGGFTKIAAPRRARLLRFVNGRSFEQRIDLKAVASGGQGDKDFVLEPNDVVYVPQSVF